MERRTKRRHEKPPSTIEDFPSPSIHLEEEMQQEEPKAEPPVSPSKIQSGLGSKQKAIRASLDFSPRWFVLTESGNLTEEYKEKCEKVETISEDGYGAKELEEYKEKCEKVETISEDGYGAKVKKNMQTMDCV
ncbi:hypothetical protein L7F22_058179 [Adiantum nelumboides]|nr:hypothetical protein [Adiantum nelumboides]